MTKKRSQPLCCCEYIMHGHSCQPLFCESLMKLITAIYKYRYIIQNYSTGNTICKVLSKHFLNMLKELHTIQKPYCNPSRASVFEELIHTYQYRTGKHDGSHVSRLKYEIEAQEKLSKHSKAYQLTEKEIEQTKA